jgi:hypothetical protein
MHINKLILAAMFITLWHGLWSQSQSVYVLRGIVADEVTQQPLIGALVYVVNHENNATTTNESGEFAIEGLPVGRHNLQVSYLGFVPFSTLVEIKSGKEQVVQVMMKEAIKTLDEVTVTANAEKAKPINSFAFASTRTFSVEESSKFAGAVDDPARMAQSFAGVIPTDDGSNYVSVRGNHPSGLLYRLEGIDMPNPNHFGDVASSGGGVSILSSQVLSNSDFSTGAFSAEYSNALGGVFDIRLRKGNNSKNEFTLKAGFLGMEAAIEGPFSKKYKGAYLVNYRYSTLSLINKLGVDLTGVLNYSDLSYHVHLPVNGKGTFSLFGINGRSNQKIEENLDDINPESGALSHLSDGAFVSNMSMNGAKYAVSTKKNGFFNAIVAYSTNKSGFDEDIKTVYKDYTYFSKFNISQYAHKYSVATHFTQKINSLIHVKTGLYYDILGYRLRYDDYQNESSYTTIINRNDQTSVARGYGQVNIRWNDKWSVNVGAHYSYFLLNSHNVFEPRVNLKYTFNDKSNVALSYGRHSQLQPLIVYFIKNEREELINKNLDFTKAQHLVLTYNYDINAHFRFKTEVYFQQLRKIPVGMDGHKNYSIINQQNFFPDFKLVNEGKGRNMGLEVTLERFLHKNWYYILTASVFDSKYKTPNLSRWNNTRYNVRYSSIWTIGKEWLVGKNKRNTLGVNVKNAWIGGQWDTPVDRAASQLEKKEVRDEANPFSVKLKDFQKLDVGIRYKRNKNKYTSTLSLDLMNATNHKNVGGITYDIQNDRLKEWTMMPFVPVMSYKVEF